MLFGFVIAPKVGIFFVEERNLCILNDANFEIYFAKIRGKLRWSIYMQNFALNIWYDFKKCLKNSINVLILITIFMANWSKN